MRKFIILAVFSILTAGASGQTGIAPLDIDQRTLQNGLQVVTVRDTATPLVSVQVWYRVGSKDDPDGKSGFAHMFEHMMFKATKNMPNEKMDRLTEDVGGFNNAFTADDTTAYYEVVPSNYLETLLWAESDRMVNLAVDKGNFESERDVVKEEYRQRYETNPYGMLFWYVDNLSYKVHPYKRPGIGNLEELSAATLEDAFKFYREYYRPDNAALIVVGDFDSEQLDRWVDKYFGRIEKPADNIKRVTAVEPPRTETARFIKLRPNVPLPAVAITYLAPPSTSNEIPALEIAAAILSDGRSSRIYQELIYKQQLAQDAGFFTDIRTDTGLLTFYGIAASGKSIEAIEAAFLKEISKLKTEGPTADELMKAKNKLVVGILEGRETVNGKAQAIGNAIIYQNDPDAVNSDVAKLQQVTIEDVVQVMNRHFDENKRTVIYYKQGDETGAKK